MLVAAGVAASAVIRREEAVLSEAAFRRGAWDASQTWAEWLRLQAAITPAMTSGSEAALDDLELRIDIVRSRLRSHLLPALEPAVDPGRLADLRARMARGIAAAEAFARSPSDPALARYAAEILASANVVVGRLASDAHVADSDRLTTARENLVILHRVFIGIVLLGILCALGLIGLLAHNNRRLRTARSERRIAEEKVALAMDASGAGWWSRVGDEFQPSTRARSMMGLPPGEGIVDMREVRRLVHPDDVYRLDRGPAEGSGAEGGTCFAAIRITHPARGVRWLAILGQTAPAVPGMPLRAHGIIIDETERRNLEEDLRVAKDAAERAVAAKSRMLASASHDLRQPLQSMFLVAAALDAENEPTRRAELSRLLEQGMVTLKALLDSVVEVARIESGSTQPKIEDFPLMALMAEIEGAYAPRAVGKGLTFRVEPSMAIVQSDRVLLGRMLRNLVENALRYTETGSVELVCLPDLSGVRIEVRDTGSGIPEDNLELIWEEFHQIGNRERDRMEGLGLGLAIVRMLGRTLGHPVAVSSDPGKGSVFSVTVPLGEAATRQPETIPVAPTDGRCVAVVDDDPIVLAALRAALSAAGYSVVPAGSGDEVVVAVRSAGVRPGFIVADYRLRGGETGTLAVAKLRAALGVQIPALILTGEVGEDAAADAARHGVDLVEKPVPARVLIERIEHAPSF